MTHYIRQKTLTTNSAFSSLVAPETIDAICFDMDGVLADLFGVPDWEDRLIREDDFPYADAEPLVAPHLLNSIINKLHEVGISTYVVSWGAMRGRYAERFPDATPEQKAAHENSGWYYDWGTRRVKKLWMEKYFPSIDTNDVFVVQYGTSKSSVIENLCENPLLFDDSPSNCEEWQWDNAVNICTGRSEDIILSTLSDLCELVEYLKAA